jgi:hypothetical protein
MKKNAILILFLLPLIAFGLVSTIGHIINVDQIQSVTSVSIIGPDIYILDDGSKIVRATKVNKKVQLSYSYEPYDAVYSSFVWSVVSGTEYVDINQYGIVTILEINKEAIIKLVETNSNQFDLVKFIMY